MANSSLQSRSSNAAQFFRQAQPPFVSIIRDAQLTDVAALCEAERAVVRQFDGLLVSEPDELAESAFAERVALAAEGKAKYLVVEEGGACVAHASLHPMSLRNVSHVLRLDMCVHLGHWRQGHGQRLLAALLAWARRQPKAYKVELLVRAENGAAVALYRKLGFTEEGRHRHRVRLRSGRFADDLSMALLLKAQ